METFIYIEPSGEGIDSIVKQMAIKIGRISPELRGPLKGICIGNHLKGKETQLKGLVDELMMVEVPPGIESNTEVISKILTDLVKENGPGILFLGFTFQGMELGPAVGWRLQVPVITNCSAFEWNKGEAYVTRPIHGGKLLISSTVNLERGAVFSVQKGAWKEDGGSVGMNPVSIKPLSWRDSWVAEKTEVVGISEATLEGEEDITKAQVLVSVGRGLGDPENLPIVKELADKLGAMISSSRPVVDLGWLPASRQVGISGRTVGPVIYLALGISGQANHLAGISPSTTIIAINKDPSAPIFNAAKYGIVDDLLQFVPEFLQKIKQKKSNA
ncbi:MAG: electron transfer flavoprotein subunit alpha/FixB family protein [Thermodesulfobacteriota bacterium]|nr:electron transfer flavoprotein subunit alpha/FixB family protein [Thermodesulfobacteriota bacterium]